MHIAPRQYYAATRYDFLIDISIKDDFYPGLQLVCTPDTRQEIVIERNFGQNQTGGIASENRKSTKGRQIDWIGESYQGTIVQIILPLFCTVRRC